MRFLAFYPLGDYGIQYISEESAPEGRRPEVTEELSGAFHFHSFKDAKEMADRVNGFVEAIDEPAEFRSLKEAAEALDSLRADMLFSSDDLSHLPRYAEQHLLLALASMETAIHHLTIGWMEQMDNR